MAKKPLLPEGGLDAGMINAEEVWRLKKRSVAGGVSASNFLVTGQCTPESFGFFPLNTGSPWCYNFFFFLLRSSKRHFYE